MEKSLIDKLKEVIAEHYEETGEKLYGLNVGWYITVSGSNDAISDVRVELRK